MYHVRQENLPFVGSAHEFVGASRATLVFRCFCSTGTRDQGRGLTGIPMTKSSSSVKAEECGQ